MTPLPDPTSVLRAGADRARRWLFMSVGIWCVGLGAAGVFIPGLPTTIFLILASFFLIRSCPWLEERLVRNRFFAPYVRYLDGDVPMPRKAKIAANLMMWSMIALSCALLISRETAWWVIACIVAAGVGGSVMIARFRGLKRPAQSSQSE